MAITTIKELINEANRPGFNWGIGNWWTGSRGGLETIEYKAAHGGAFAFPSNEVDQLGEIFSRFDIDEFAVNAYLSRDVRPLEDAIEDAHEIENALTTLYLLYKDEYKPSLSEYVKTHGSVSGFEWELEDGSLVFEARHGTRWTIPVCVADNEPDMIKQMLIEFDPDDLAVESYPNRNTGVTLEDLIRDANEICEAIEALWDVAETLK